MLRLDTITIPAGYEPPRPTLAPRRRVQVMRHDPCAGVDNVVDWGLGVSRFVRFVSSESQGLITGEQVEQLLTLYETGASFALETDLLKPLGGAPDVYTARFDPATGPAFTPADPGGRFYYLDLPLVLQ